MKYLFVILVVAKLFVFINGNKYSSGNSELDKIKLKDGLFVDSYGRVRLFHGANYVEKEYPWYPWLNNYDLTNETQLDNLKAWGFNAVRLGVMWSGLRPDQNTVNQTYLNIILDIIKNLGQRGIYTIVEMHQDMMSTKYASYDGVPRWLLDLMPNSTFPYPWPFEKYYLGFTAYLTEACSFGFQNLYSNVNKFQDYFADYWSIVSQTLADYNSVLGYEFINEPWAGDIYSNPELLLPGKAGDLNLLPMYDNIYKTIRANDNNTLVFYEPVTWGIIFNGTLFGTGFNRAPGNDPNRTVLSWHYYCWLIQSNPLENGTYPIIDRVICDELQRYLAFATVKLDNELIGGGSFLTEFGVCAFDIGNGTLDTTECQYVLDIADEYFTSWTFWNSIQFYDKNGNPQDSIISKFSRVYPTATSGLPVFLNYNTTTNIFIYEYTPDSLITAPTEIFVPDHVYLNGFQVTVSEQLKWTYDQENSLILLTLIDKTLKSTIAKITIEPKQNFL